MDPSAPPSFSAPSQLTSNQNYGYPSLQPPPAAYYASPVPAPSPMPMESYQQKGQPGTFLYSKLPEEEVSSTPVISPFGGEKGCVVEEMAAIDYEVNIKKWFSDSWHIYKQHWIAFTIFTILQIAVNFIPFIGRFLTIPLLFGVFLAVTNKIRANGPNGDMRYDHFVFGFLFLIPIALIGLLSLLLIAFGFVLCILPGLYALFALSFSIPIFLEFHGKKIGMIGSMILSVKIINKHLVEMIVFLIINSLLGISGILFLGVGLLVTLPLSSIVFTMAFRDIFGLNPTKEQENTCILC